MKAQRLLLGTNWKMNKTVREATEYACELLQYLSTIKGVESVQLFAIPPFTAIAAVKQVSAGKFWVGAQNMHWEPWGPYTGEISAPMLQELGVDLVELGHAERRQYFNESDKAINRKVQTALQYGFRPLICLGEGWEEKEYGVEREAVGRQLRIALKGILGQQAPNLIIAYEPAWSIGEAGAAASPEHVRYMVNHIRGLLREIFGSERATAIPIVYGGDVHTGNAVDLLEESEIDGLFVGRAAWQVKDFADLIRVCIEASARRKSLIRGNR